MKDIWRNGEMRGRIIRICGIVAIVGVLIAAIVASMSHAEVANAEKVWYPEMTVGNMEAKNYFVIYSDVACPYCVAFENAILGNEEEFRDYIEKNDVLLEVRVADFLYQYGESQPIESRLGAEAIYCAKNQGKFWEYYDAAIQKIWKEYFETAGKAAFTEFNKLGKDYWIQIGEGVGLGDDFARCIREDESLDEVISNSQRMARTISGMPYFKFNKYESSGFDLSWGWNYVKMYFDAGLKSK